MLRVFDLVVEIALFLMAKRLAVGDQELKVACIRSVGRALSAVSRAGRVLVTANGKPRAIMIPTSEATFARDLEMLDRVALAQAVASIRADSVQNGTDNLSMDAINEEIAAVRSARKRALQAAPAKPLANVSRRRVTPHSPAAPFGPILDHGKESSQ